jgi:hypothetical protein
MLEKLKMTDFQPTPQTPEQVADGLRNAFRQAMKDGVMDATPYLKQMTYKSDIEKTEAEIKVLQKKLELLKEIEKHKSPVEEAYKDWWGEYPSTEKSISETEDMRWAGFQAGFQAAYEEKVREDDYYNEVEKDNPNIQKVIDKMVEERKSQKLYNIFKSYNYPDFIAENICNIVEEWLPQEQSASGSQNTFVECSVEGYNDCVRQMKEMLR